MSSTPAKIDSPADAEVRVTSGSTSADLASWTIIRPPSRWQMLDLVELWHYRDLLRMLAWRDIKVRYKQTLIGAAWAIVQPLSTMLIFYVLFGLLGAKPVSGEVPYMVSVYSGLLLWQLFAGSLTRSSASLFENQALLTKVYCPRLVFPLAPVLVALVDFAVACVILVGLMVWCGVVPTWSLAAVPVFVLLTALTALAFGLWFASLAAMYRDFVYVVPFVVQIWMYLTPVLYESDSVVPERWRAWYFLNPMAGIVEGFRWALFGQRLPSATCCAMSATAVAVLLLGGLLYFRRVEQTLADWV